MSPIQGYVSNRQHNFGRQSLFGTKVPAVRAYGFKGVPDPNLNWTDPDVDTGSIYPVVSPTKGAPNLTAALTDPRLSYNSLPLLFSGIFGGAVTPTPGGGGSFQWDYAPAGRAPLDEDDPFSYEFGDDVLTFWEQYGDGVLERVEITGPEGLGVLTTSMTWRFGSYSNTGSTALPVDGTVPTPGVTPDVNEALVYLKDLGIYIASSPYDLDGGQIMDALHSFVLRITQARDLKRFANADQSFDIDFYGKGKALVELELTFAETDDIVGTGSETDAWTSDEAVNRFIRIAGESTIEAESGTPYSFNIEMPLRYYTMAHGAVGNNATVVLTGHNFDEADLFNGPFRATIVNTLAGAGL